MITNVNPYSIKQASFGSCLFRSVLFGSVSFRLVSIFPFSIFRCAVLFWFWFVLAFFLEMHCIAFFGLFLFVLDHLSLFVFVAVHNIDCSYVLCRYHTLRSGSPDAVTYRERFILQYAL